MTGAEALWPFVLRVYGGEGVQAACLRLQESCGTDVPVLLFAAWLGQRGIVLDDAEMRRVDNAVGPWRHEIVHALRQVRQRLKSGPAPAPGAASEALRSMVKGAELTAEKLELELLDALSRAMAVSPDHDRAALTLANMVCVARHFGGGAQADPHRADLLTIAAAV